MVSLSGRHHSREVGGGFSDRLRRAFALGSLAPVEQDTSPPLGSVLLAFVAGQILTPVSRVSPRTAPSFISVGR
jgi:hypothetical protein